MRFVFAALIALHGSIHLLGVAKAFGARSLPLQQAIGKPLGIVWLLAALCFLLSAVLVVVRSELLWVALLPAIVISQGLIFSAFQDAKFGSLANIALLLPVCVALLAYRPSSFRSMFAREAAARLDAAGVSPLEHPSETQRLPQPIREYLERVGATQGRPGNSFHVRFHGEIRRSTEASWMTFDAEQVSVREPAARLFLLKSSLVGVPFDALHVYRDGTATMKARVAELIDVVDARGPEMDQSEMVTFFNDMCLFSPSWLVDANVHWQELDTHSVRGTFARAGKIVSAVLTFDTNHDLVNFVSDDRYLSSDGKTYSKHRCSTPIQTYQSIGGRRIPLRAEASWQLPTGEFVYAHLEIVALEYDTEPGGSARPR